MGEHRRRREVAAGSPRLCLVAAVLGVLLLAAGCSDGGAPTITALSREVPDSAVADGAGGPASPGCGLEPEVDPVGDELPGDVALGRTSGGRERTYRLAVPASYDPVEPAPLILNLHGSGSDAIQQSTYSDLPRRGAERGFVTVTPDAIGGQWEMTVEGADDAFLVELLDDVERRYCIDPDRVHVIGMSLGAWKAALTVCNHPDRFASVALVTVEVRPTDCAPTSVIAFHGTDDRTVPYGEGADPGVVVHGANAALPGARENVAAWAEGARCSPEPDLERIEPDVERRVYRGCRDGIGVELYTVEGGGHTWPGSPIDFPGTTRTIDATGLALDWFEAHPRRG